MRSAKLWWFDEGGAKSACQVEWSPEETAWLNAFAKSTENGLEDDLVGAALSLVTMFTKSELDRALAPGLSGISAPRM